MFSARLFDCTEPIMTDNIYTATSVDLSNPNAAQATFYVVSTQKFVTLFIATLGMYALYWMYKNWSLYQKATGEKIWPVMRGLFSIFFVHSLFTHVDRKISAGERSYAWSPRSQATLFVVLVIIGRILDKASAKNLGSPITDLLSILTIPALIWVMLPAQNAINLAENDPDGMSNSRFTGANYAWMAGGIVLWILAFIGIFLPDSAS
jgi:hypothetical protein